MKYILTDEEYNQLVLGDEFKREALEFRIREMRERHYKQYEEEKQWAEEHRAVIEHLFGREFGTSLDDMLHCLYEDYIRLCKLTKQ